MRTFYSVSSDVMSHSQIDFDYPDISARSEDDKGSYIKGHPRYIEIPLIIVYIVT